MYDGCEKYPRTSNSVDINLSGALESLSTAQEGSKFFAINIIYFFLWIYRLVYAEVCEHISCVIVLCFENNSLFYALSASAPLAATGWNISDMGLGEYWYYESLDVNMLPLFSERSKDQIIQSWKSVICECRKLEYYCKYKVEFIIEPYLLNVKSDILRIALTRFRLSSHSLAIETGRFLKVERENRLCLFCNQRCIETEFHFLLVCGKYRDLRCLFLNRYSTFPTINSFLRIMSSKSRKLQLSLAKYIKNAMSRRCQETNWYYYQLFKKEDFIEKY